MAKSVLDWIALILLIIGGVNWGLVGALETNLVDKIFGSIEWLAKAVYILVGVAALYSIYYLFKK